jgi:hypothetical protein
MIVDKSFPPQHPYRWLQYSITAPLIVLLIAMVSGIHDLGSLVGIWASTVVTMAFGFWFEMHAAEAGLLPICMGNLIFLVPWVVIGVHLVQTWADTSSNVVLIYFIHFMLMWTFPAALLHHWESMGRSSLRAASCKVMDPVWSV